MNITILNLQKKVFIRAPEIKKAVLRSLSLEGVKKSVNLNVLFCSDKEIKELNLLYRGRLTSTDVLSFENFSDERLIVADIAISTDTAIRNAKIYKTSPVYEVYLYVIHGLLHLLDYDDKTAKERDRMQQRAESILGIVLKQKNAKSMTQNARR